MKNLLLTITLLSIYSFAIADKGNSPMIIDVRTTAEWSTGHLDNAKHIEWQDIGDQVSALTTNKDETIYVYCHTGNRSGKAKSILDQLGYSNVINAGGMDDAQAAINTHEGL
ncbi:MAG: rhodanese-like domain-containing protein [Porticoccaceae bacterium]|jgi:phage shock protein E|nr:rhodanese-like domain-containing protein [Porticoccaceae bacterium]